VRFLTDRSDAHAGPRAAQFRYANDQLRVAVRELLDGAGVRPGARVLDYGCAESPYRNELPVGVDYVGADLPGNPMATVELDAAGRVPQADASFDVVLSTQVLEHVEDPAGYVHECSRLLVARGSLVLSTHGVMYYHRDPEDYWRWTAKGLGKVVSDAGLEVVAMKGVLALGAAALQIFQDGTIWKLPRPLRRPYAAGMQRVIAFTDRRYEESSRLENCLTIALRATKP